MIRIALVGAGAFGEKHLVGLKNIPDAGKQEEPGMRGLKGKRVIVTGGGSGIGREVCIRFAEEEAEVAVFDLNGEGARQTVRTIKDAGGRAHAYTVDITDRKAVDTAVAEFEAGG